MRPLIESVVHNNRSISVNWLVAPHGHLAFTCKTEQF
jgi:hypothetical protein